MNATLYEKYLDKITSQLDFELQRLLSNDNFDVEHKISFGFAKYVLALDVFRSDITNYNKDMKIGPWQFDNLFHELNELWDTYFTIVVNKPLDQELPENVQDQFDDMEDVDIDYMSASELGYEEDIEDEE